jgi:hypothetical protein
MIKEVHGVLSYDTEAAVQRFQIVDYETEVCVLITGQKSMCLDAEACRHLAKEFIAAARRLEKRIKK